MKKNRKGFGSDLTRIDAHVIQPEEYEEIPEWTDEMFEEADFYIGGKLVRRGRPPKEKRAKAISLRVDPDVLQAYKATGKGWQTLMNSVLKEWLEKRPQG